MQVAVRLDLGGSRLGHGTQTCLIERISEQEGRGGGNLVWSVAYTAQRHRHPRTLTCRIQSQEHRHSYHGKVAMATALFHETPASACRPTGKVDLSEDFIRL